MKEFNLEEVEAGKRVITRDKLFTGTLVEKCNPSTHLYPLRFRMSDGAIACYTLTGHFHAKRITDQDLFMAEESDSPVNPYKDLSKSPDVVQQPAPYSVTFHGHKLDIYRVVELFGITHPAHQHALKKLLRAGTTHKTLDQDIAEVIESLQRWQEMRKEDQV